MADAYCGQCGQQLEAGHRFCAECGTPTGDQEQPESGVARAFADTVAVFTSANDKESISKLAIFARAAKIIALFGFLLPWVTVSCAGQTLVSISGLSLVTGRITSRNPMTGAAQAHSVSPELIMVIAITAIGFALFVAFAWTRRKAAKAALISCSIAMVLAVFEVFVRIPREFWEAVQRDQGRTRSLGPSFDASVAQVIRTDAAIGFWITFLALGAAVFLNWLIRQRTANEESEGG